jgi:hypothetical protein
MTEDAIADLARLREIAEEGRRLPLLGGRHMILWGSAVIIALLLNWAVVTRFFALPSISLSIIWFVLMVGAAIIGSLPNFDKGQRRLAMDVGNMVERSVWQFGGSFMGIISISIFALAMFQLQKNDDPSRFMLFALIPPISFGVHAIALRTAAVVSTLDALKPYSLISLAFVALTTLLAGSHWQFPVATFGIFLVAILPGCLLIALEKAGGNG